MGLNIESDGPTGRPAAFTPPKVKQTAALAGGRFRDLLPLGGIAAYGFDLLALQCRYVWQAPGELADENAVPEKTCSSLNK